MREQMETLPHYEEMSPDEKREQARIFDRATLELEDICLPPGVELGGN